MRFRQENFCILRLLSCTGKFGRTPIQARGRFLSQPIPALKFFQVLIWVRIGFRVESFVLRETTAHWGSAADQLRSCPRRPISSFQEADQLVGSGLRAESL